MTTLYKVTVINNRQQLFRLSSSLLEKGEMIDLTEIIVSAGSVYEARQKVHESYLGNMYMRGYDSVDKNIYPMVWSVDVQ